jgi:hypothetical protein
MFGNKSRRDLTADDVHELARAFFRSRILLTAYELGVFTALGGERRTSAEVAQELDTDARATDRLMNALAVLGLLQKKGGKFANSAAAARYLVAGKPEYMAGLGHTVNLWDSWSTLTDAVRSGTTAFERPGGEAGELRTLPCSSWKASRACWTWAAAPARTPWRSRGRGTA